MVFYFDVGNKNTTAFFRPATSSYVIALRNN